MADVSPVLRVRRRRPEPLLMVQGTEGAGKDPQTRGQDILAAAPWRNKEFVRETEDQGRALPAQAPAWAKVCGV